MLCRSGVADEGIAIFNALSTMAVARHNFGFALLIGPIVRWRGKNLQHATTAFIAARYAIADRTSARRNRRDRGRQPSVCRRIGHANSSARYLRQHCCCGLRLGHHVVVIKPPAECSMRGDFGISDTEIGMDGIVS
jgi:hypothetical protein